MQWHDRKVCSKHKCVPLQADDWCCDKCQCNSICGNISVSGFWDLGLWHYLWMVLCWEVAEILDWKVLEKCHWSWKVLEIC